MGFKGICEKVLIFYKGLYIIFAYNPCKYLKINIYLPIKEKNNDKIYMEMIIILQIFMKIICPKESNKFNVRY